MAPCVRTDSACRLRHAADEIFEHVAQSPPWFCAVHVGVSNERIRFGSYVKCVFESVKAKHCREPVAGSGGLGYADDVASVHVANGESAMSDRVTGRGKSPVSWALHVSGR